MVVSWQRYVLKSILNLSVLDCLKPSRAFCICMHALFVSLGGRLSKVAENQCFEE